MCLERYALTCLGTTGYHPWMVAADWNSTAQELFTKDMLEQLGAKVFLPGVETCVSPTSARVLDYFLVDNGLGAAVMSVEIIMNAATRPHRPVLLKFRPGATEVYKRVFKPTIKLSSRGMYRIF